MNTTLDYLGSEARNSDSLPDASMPVSQSFSESSAGEEELSKLVAKFSESREPAIGYWISLQGSFTVDAAYVDLQNEFRGLARKWRSERGAQSNMLMITSSPSYLRIIGLGKPVVPFILYDLERKPDHWFVALRSITNADPVSIEDRGRLVPMTNAWLQWGRENRYI